VRPEWRRTVGVGRRCRRSGVSPPTESDRLGFVGSPVARQSLDLVLRRLPSIYVALREGGSTAIHGKRPRSGRGRNWFSNFGDLSKREGITFLTFSHLIFASYLNSIILLFTNQCIGHTTSWQSVMYYQTQ
jgi:hypothetical protein